MFSHHLDQHLKRQKRRRDEMEEDDILTNRLFQRAAFNSNSSSSSNQNQPPTKKQRSEYNELCMLNTMMKLSSNEHFLLVSRTNEGHQRVRHLLSVKSQHLKELSLYKNMLEVPGINTMPRRLLIQSVFEKMDDVDDQMEEAKAALSVAMNALKNFDEVDYYGHRADEMLRERLGMEKTPEIIISSTSPPKDIYVSMSASVDSLSDVTATDTEDE